MEFTANDILTLSRAGYNSAEIAAIAARVTADPAPAAKTRQTEQEPAAKTQQTEQEPAAKTQQTEQEPAAKTQQTELSGIMAELKALRGAVQASNMRTDKQPQSETSGDIIAKIIRPPLPDNK